MDQQKEQWMEFLDYYPLYLRYNEVHQIFCLQLKKTIKIYNLRLKPKEILLFSFYISKSTIITHVSIYCGFEIKWKNSKRRKNTIPLSPTFIMNYNQSKSMD